MYLSEDQGRAGDGQSGRKICTCMYKIVKKLLCLLPFSPITKSPSLITFFLVLDPLC